MNTNSGRRSPWRWVILTLAVLQMMTHLIARCSDYSNSNDTPKYQPSFGQPGLTSVAEADLVPQINPFSSGTKIFATKTLSVIYPPLWNVRMPDQTSIEMHGASEFIQLFWEDVPKMDKMWQMKQTNSEQFAWIDSEAEHIFRAQLKSPSNIILDFSRHSPGEFRNVPILFGIYEVHSIEEAKKTTIAHFVTRCAPQRACTFEYIRMSQQPINANEWEMLAQIASSLHFFDSAIEKVKTPESQPISPLSPLRILDGGG
ncbi:MAG: hypothetical protein U0350_29460 [Caldilineaceae bacterium]